MGIHITMGYYTECPQACQKRNRKRLRFLLYVTISLFLYLFLQLRAAHSRLLCLLNIRANFRQTLYQTGNALDLGRDDDLRRLAVRCFGKCL